DREVDFGRRYAASGQRSAGGWVRAGDVGIGSEVQVEHGRLRALEKDVCPRLQCLLNDWKRVLDERVELFRVAHVLVEHGFPVDGVLSIELGEDRVLDLADDEGELLAHEGFLLEVADTETDAPDLVRVRGSDAA